MKKILFSMLFVILLAATPTYANERKVVTCNLNVRTGPGTSYSKFTTLPKGTEVVVTGETGNWSEVLINDQSYFMYTKYLKSKNEVSNSEKKLKSTDFGASRDFEYLGEFQITHYCSCPICCGQWGDVTYSGTVPMVDITVATDKHVIPMGSVLWIDGYNFRLAEDIGSAVKGNHIDVFVGDDHELAKKLGTVYKDVWIMR